MRQIYSFTEFSNDLTLNSVGSKAYNLMAMTSAGINVPSGFVLTAQVEMNSKLEDVKSLIADHLTGLKSSYVMVRSSGVGEDGSDYSYAGQLDSFQVENELSQVAQRVLDCWNSLKNHRLQVYSHENHTTIEQMGVIVQEMIEPEYAGVLFTQAPNRPGAMLMEYVEGHCEKLVSGEVTPESVYIAPDEDSEKGFINQVVLNAKKILQFYESGQDIEWAYADEEVYIVQSRPITAETNPISWSSTNVNENYPDKLSPLLYSIARRSYYHYFKNLAHAFHIKLTPQDEASFYNIIGLWGERMYYNMSSIHQVIGLTPFRGLLSKSFDNFVGYQKKISSKQSHPTKREKLKFLALVLYNAISLKRNVTQIENLVTNYVHRNKDISQLALYHEFLDLRFNQWHKASFADFFAMLSHGALGKFLEKIDPDKAAGLQNTLIQSIPNLISNRPIFELWQLKEYVLQHELQAVFQLESSSKIWESISSEEQYNGLKRRIEKYLSDWGFRCSGELTFLTENYSERPELFIDMFRAYVSADNQNPSEQFSKKHEEQKKILKDLCIDINHRFSALTGIYYTIALKMLVRFTMFSISCRERVRLKQAHMYYKFKTVCLQLGNKLSERKLLASKEEVFYLEYEELSRILNEEHMDKDYLKELISIRKAKFDRAMEYPENFFGDNINYTNTYYDQDGTNIAGENAYAGLPACGGTVSARAVVLNSVHEIHKLKKGDILVTKQTDPGWICAFPLISGLVVERGGMLSHGAIVAREFGIPAVVGIKDITQIIKTNEEILVDGNKGIVECHKPLVQ